MYFFSSSIILFLRRVGLSLVLIPIWFLIAAVLKLELTFVLFVLACAVLLSYLSWKKDSETK